MIFYISLGAICLLAISYWLQVRKIHMHREVRDLSVGTYVFLLCGYFALTLRAIEEESLVFLIRQLATIIPVSVILFQIWIHKKDRWHADNDIFCKCKKELEPQWKFCPYCSNPTKVNQK